MRIGRWLYTGHILTTSATVFDVSVLHVNGYLWSSIKVIGIFAHDWNKLNRTNTKSRKYDDEHTKVRWRKNQSAIAKCRKLYNDKRARMALYRSPDQCADKSGCELSNKKRQREGIGGGVVVVMKQWKKRKQRKDWKKNALGAVTRGVKSQGRGCQVVTNERKQWQK